jgi:hypothetical protein
LKTWFSDLCRPFSGIYPLFSDLCLLSEKSANHNYHRIHPSIIVMQAGVRDVREPSRPKKRKAGTQLNLTPNSNLGVKIKP